MPRNETHLLGDVGVRSLYRLRGLSFNQNPSGKTPNDEYFLSWLTVKSASAAMAMSIIADTLYVTLEGKAATPWGKGLREESECSLWGLLRMPIEQDRVYTRTILENP